MGETLVKTSCDHGVARVTLCRAPLNVLTIEMLGELSRAVRWAVDEPSHIVLIDAEGKAFSAGVDIGDHEEGKVDQASSVFASVFETLWETEKPVIAAVDGYALGGGCELAMAADIIVASEKAKFGQPEIGVGAIASIACYRLTRKVLPSHAFELLLTGKPISASRAYSIGLVNEVFPAEDFRESVDRYLERFTSLSSLLLAKTKKAVRLADGKDWKSGIAAIDELYEKEVTPSYDAHEGIAAFLEKRPPIWENR